MKNKLYQMFILGTSGNGYKQAILDGLGGIIYFTHDIQTKEQFKNLILECKKYSNIPLFFSIDQEGGRVERTENIYNGKKYLSAKFAFEKGEEFLKKQTEQIAQELKNFGINLNFSPCIDVNTNLQNPIIGERAFSNNTEDVIKAGKIVCDTYKKNGIIPCLKHYPGHGDAETDSHLTLPKIDLSLSQMEKYHIKPFIKLSESADIIMVAHLYCTCFGTQILPASLNKNAIDYLREKTNFEGILISDDMMMKGIADFDLTDAIIMGIKAGLNMFIYRNSDEKIISAIEKVVQYATTDKLLSENITNSYTKIIKLKKKYL